MSFLCFRRSRMTALASIAFLLAVAGSTSAEPVEEFSDTSRLVSVGGSLTEIIFALGGQDRLVARDQTSTYPEAANALPDVGYMRRLSPEGVLSVNPSGILMLEGSGPQETLDVLDKASVPIITVPDAHTAESVIQKIVIVGRALGLEQKAKALAADVSRELTAVQELVADKDQRKRILFILSAQAGRLTVSGRGTAADGMIKLAGGVNAIDGFEGYKQLTDEAIDVAAPDVILFMDAASDNGLKDELLKNPALANTPAGRNNSIIQMEALYLLGFGPRTAAAGRELAMKLYAPTGEQ